MSDLQQNSNIHNEAKPRSFIERYYCLVITLLVILLVIIVSTILISGYAKSQKSILPRSLTEIEQKQLADAYERICTVEVETCNDLKGKQITFRVIPLDGFYSLLNFDHYGDYAVTFKNESGFEIRISDSLFPSNIPLTIFLYHEYQHVRVGKYFSIDPNDQQAVVSACIEHNYVKQLTWTFANKLEKFLTGNSITVEQIDSPKSIASLKGNQPIDCNAIQGGQSK